MRFLIVFVLLLAIAGCGPSGPDLKPVRGKVLVNGKPAERVALTFIHVDPSVKGNAAHPRASTDAHGVFQLSSESNADGAVVGEYLVGFIWWSDPDPDRAKDLLGGAYADPQKTGIKVKIAPEGPNELGPFELKADEAEAARFVK